MSVHGTLGYESYQTKSSNSAAFLRTHVIHKAAQCTRTRIVLGISVRGGNGKKACDCVSHVCCSIPADTEWDGSKQCAAKIGSNDPYPRGARSNGSHQRGRQG